MRVAKSVENVPVLVVIGVNEFGQRMVLGLQAGDKESATCWKEFFKDLKRRGLDGRNVQLGIMDGLPGLERIFTEEFPKAKIQRCQVHVAKKEPVIYQYYKILSWLISHNLVDSTRAAIRESNSLRSINTSTFWD